MHSSRTETLSSVISVCHIIPPTNDSVFGAFPPQSFKINSTCFVMVKIEHSWFSEEQLIGKHFSDLSATQP